MISVENVTVSVGSFTLSGASLEVGAGEYCVLMGTTGCGKTTLLEAVCGLKAVASGSISLSGRDVTRLRPAERGIGFVPQDGAVFATMNVFENIAFALRVRDWKEADVKARVDELAEMLGLEKLLERSTTGLSGGERQRVALGRALAFRPEILCLDEPLSALDHDTRDDMCDLLKDVQRKTGVTAFHITHNRNEALRLADRFYRFVDGKIEEDDPGSIVPGSNL